METQPVDVDAIAAQLADREVVLLGEATHGSHEFYALRAAISRRLIAAHGFSAIAIEGDWPDAQRAARFVRGEGGDRDAAHALGDFRRFPTWMWRNHEVVELLTWLREQASHTGFYGLDLYSLHASAAQVLAYLDRVDPAAALRARQRYACFDHLEPEQYARFTHLGLSEDCEEEVVAQLAEMQRAALANDAAFEAVQNAHVVRDAEAYYRAMFGGRQASWNLRDTHMADTLDALAARGKVIVWAHNSHVGDARATAMGDGGEITLGQLARLRHRVALVGFTTYDGTVACARDWDEPVYIERVRPALPGSWEQMFHQVGLPRFAVAASELPAGAHLHRAIGVVYRPETERRSHYFAARMREQFDLVIHVDRTRAVSPLEVGQPGSIEELPETFPTGV
jgi:erythromycin esterase-like protein